MLIQVLIGLGSKNGSCEMKKAAEAALVQIIRNYMPYF